MVIWSRSGRGLASLCAALWLALALLLGPAGTSVAAAQDGPYVLDVPYVPQEDGTPYGAVNCGPASVAMLLPVSYSALRLGGLLDMSSVVLVGAGPALLLSRTVPPAVVWRPVWRLFLEVVVTSPPRLLVSSFAALCAIGTLFLALPVSASGGRALPLVDALFKRRRLRERVDEELRFHLEMRATQLMANGVSR